MEQPRHLTGTPKPDWRALRALFPALAQDVYLNTATSGPISREAAEAAKLYYDLAMARGDRNRSVWHEAVEATRQTVARFIGASPAEIGFVHNTSMAMSCAALLFEGAGSVLTAVGEHPAVVTPWYARGYRVDKVSPDADGRLTVERYRAAIQSDTRIIAVSFVRFNDGFPNNLRALGSLARSRGIHLVVDAIQGAGILPINVADGIDILGFGAFKWLNAGYGGGALYVRDGLVARYGLPLAGNRSRITDELVEIERLEPLLSAGAFELGSINAPGVMALGAALNLIEKIGPIQIETRVRQLSRRFRSGLAASGFRTMTEHEADWSTPIISVFVKDPDRAFATLKAAGVNVAIRQDRVRVAISWYNNEADCDQCLAAFSKITPI